MGFAGIVLLAISAWITLSGLITPKTSKPIGLTYNNSDVRSDYTFRFQIETMTRPDSVLNVYFPPADYLSGLGMSTCSASNEKGGAYPCTVSGTTVAVTVGQLYNSPADNTYVVTVKGVSNPSHTGATGWFRLETFSGINLLDYSDLFGQVGLIPAPVSISAAFVSCIGTCQSGATAALQVSFTPALDVTPGQRIRIKFPSGLTLMDPPPCVSSQVTTALCSQVYPNYVYIAGVSQTVKKDTNILFYFSNVQLNSYSGNIGSFDLLILEPNTNNLVQIRLAISGPISAPGSVYNISICPNGGSPCAANDPIVSQGNTMLMTIVASTTNNIPSTGAVVITFPSSFGVFTASTCVILSGFQNQSSATILNQLTCISNSSARTLTITNFAGFLRGQFSLAVRVKFPSSSGPTAAFQFNTYADLALTQLIDSDISATSVVAAIPQPSKLVLSWGSATLTAGTSQSLQIVIRPTSAIPAPLTSYRFRVRFPVGFQFTGTLSAWLRPNSYYTDMQLTGATWDAVGRVMDLPLVVGPASIPTGLDSILDINSGGSQIVLPSSPGDYSIQVSIFDGSSDREAALSWVTVAASPLSSFSVLNLSRDINQKTRFTFSFVPSVKVPASTVWTDVTAPWGLIEFQFPSQNGNLNPLFPLDLGSGLTSTGAGTCRVMSGLTGNVSCLIVPTAGKVQIVGFGEIAAGTSVVVDLVNVSNAQTSGVSASITAQLSSVVQSFPTAINTASASLPQSFYYNGSVSLPKINGRSPSPNGDGKNTVTFAPNRVNATGVSASFVLWLENPVGSGAGNSLIVKFPMSYSLPSSGVGCVLQYTAAQTCYTYPGAGWVVFPALGQALSAYTEYPVTLTGLTNPQSRIYSAALTIVTVSGYVETEYVYFSAFTPFGLGNVSNVSLAASSYKTNDYDVSYTFIFSPNDPIPTGGQIALTFPKGSYSLLTTPVVSCSVSGALGSAGSGVVCTPMSNTVVVTGFAAYSPGLPIYVKVMHVLNPAQVGLTDSFSIETTTSSGLLIDASYSVPGLLIATNPRISSLSHLGFYSDPSNGLFPTSLILKFRPAVTYPQKSVIQITYPSEFAVVSGSTGWRVTGGITTMEAVTVVGGSVIAITTDTEYLKTDWIEDITVTASGVKNISPGVTSGLVRIDVFYSGSLIDSSSFDERNRTLYTDLSPAAASLPAYDTTVITASEPAEYQFSINLASNFAANCSVNIEFPSGFPRRLGSILACFSTELSLYSNATVECSVEDRVLKVNGTKGWNLGGTQQRFNLTVKRVINPPAKAAQGNFKVYTKCGTRILDYGDSSGPVIQTSYAASMYYDSTNITTNLQGYTSNLGLKTQTYAGFRSVTEDLVLVDFPRQYDMTFCGPIVTCQSDLSQLTPCSYSTNRLSLSPFSLLQDTSAKTTYSFLLNSIENPYTFGDLPYITTSIYSMKTKTVVAKTFPNLNVASSFSFTTLGPSLLINYNREWSLPISTMTDPLLMSMESKSEANFTVSILNDLPYLSMTPTTVVWSVGDTFKPFRIAVGPAAPLGRHYIEWKVISEQSLNLAPIRRSFFTVTNDYFLIAVDPVDHIPQGGSSRPIQVSLPKAPNAPLTMRLIKLGALPTLVKFNPAQLRFDAGELTKSFRIAVDGDSSGSQGEFYIYKEGESQDAYRLPMDTFRFIVTERDGDPPSVVGIRVTEVGRNTLGVAVEMSEECTVYALIAPYGTHAPSISQLQAFTSATPSAEQFFNQTSDSGSSDRYIYSLQFSNLTAQTRYVLFVNAIDLGNNPVPNTANLTVTTNDRYPLAGFRLKLKVDSLGDDYKKTIITRISQVLAVKQSLVGFLNGSQLLYTGEIEDSDTPLGTTTSGRSLSIASMYANMVVYPDPKDPSEVSPLDYINFLNAKRLKLKSVLPEYDTSVPIVGIELKNYPPLWLSDPSAVLDVANNLQVYNLALQASGYAFICVLSISTAKTRPTSLQVVSGLDSENSPCQLVGSTYVSSAAGSYVVPKLTPGVEYWVYISATNEVPRYPAIMKDTDVAVIGLKVFQMQAVAGTEGLEAAIALVIGIGML